MLEHRSKEQAKEIGKFFAQRRYLRGWTQRQLGVMSTLGQAAVTNFETGKSDFKLSTLHKLAQTHGFEVRICMVPIDGGDPVEAKPDPDIRVGRSYDTNSGKTFPNRKPPTYKKPRARKEILPGPQVVYESDDEFDIAREMAALRARLGVSPK